MLKVFATQVIVSKGYDGAASLRFSENGDSVRFRIGKRVYDSREADEHRWVNISVKAFNGVCERIKKMQLKEGSCINLIGRLDEDIWKDQTTGEKKTCMVIILDDIEYASGGKPKDKQNAEQSAPAEAPANTEMPAAFTGYEAFGGGSFFDEN